MPNTEEKLSVSSDTMLMATVVGPRATIQSVRLVNVSAMLGSADPEAMKYVRNRRTSTFARGSGNSLDVDIRFTIDIATSEADKSEPPISIEAKYRLTYKVEDLATLDDEHLRAFTQVNGYFNAWPFWRELTTSMMARSQAGLFLLPTLRVQTTSEPGGEAKENS